MTYQISILGLGQIGGSIGLALASKKEQIRRVGYDRDSDTIRTATRLGVADSYTRNLPEAVRDADLVILTEPLEWIKTTLAEIKPDLKPEVVLIDTTVGKAAVESMMMEIYPEKIHYVGLTLLINGQYLQDNKSGIDAARSDLFQGGLAAVNTSSYSSNQALQTAADLIRLIGASPLYTDSAEVDGLTAAVTLLPQVCAAAMFLATQSQSGWIEARKFTGRDYVNVTAPVESIEGVENFGQNMLANRENLLRMIDEYTQHLGKIRSAIDTADETGLKDLLKDAYLDHAEWFGQRQSGKWPELTAVETPVPSVGERLFGTMFKKKDKK